MATNLRADPGAHRCVLLGDDMGVGKTVQILTFLAWCIESGRFPELSRTEPPFRPILIVAPLILLDTRTWETEMENFFPMTVWCFGRSFLYTATSSRSCGALTPRGVSWRSASRSST